MIQASLVAQMVKNLTAEQETQVRSPGLEDPLEEGMATHCSILAWRIPRTEEPGGLQPVGSHRVRHDGENVSASSEGYSDICKNKTLKSTQNGRLSCQATYVTF